MDVTGWSRKKTCIINAIAMMVLVLPCALCWSVLKDVHPFGGTSTIMDLEDFIVSNCLLPLGSLAYVLFCTTRYGWGWDAFMKEANTGKGLKVASWMRGYVTWVLPAIIVVLFFIGVYNFFA